MKPYQTVLFFLIVLLAILSGDLFAQRLQFTHGCAFSKSPEQTQEYYAQDPSEEVEAILDKLRSAIGIERDHFKLKSANVDNAFATVIERDRYILFSSAFILDTKRSTQDQWTVYLIVAHEIGHHLLGHQFDVTDPDYRKLLELEADRFAGRQLRNLCATEEEAAQAITFLEDVAVAAGYPPYSARLDAVTSGWYQQDQELKRNNRDPCQGVVIEPKLGKRYGNINLAHNPKAEVEEKLVRFQFDATSQPRRGELGTYLITAPDSRLTPRSIEWLTDPQKTGQGRQFIWHFARDGYTRDQVLKAEELGIGVFTDRQKPRLLRWTQFLGPGLCLAGGGVAYGIAQDRQAAAGDLYDGIYAVYRSENDAVYEDGNPSRDDVYRDANDKHQAFQAWRNGSYVLLAGGAIWLTERIIKNRKGKFGSLYVGEYGVGIQVNPSERFYR